MKELFQLLIFRLDHFNNTNYIKTKKQTNNRFTSRRRLRKQKLVQSCFIYGLLISIILFSTLKLNASAETIANKQQEYKYFTSYQIQYGDTLWGIAGQYNPEASKSEIAKIVKEIRDINHLSPYSGITAGEHVVVPYYSAEYK